MAAAPAARRAWSQKQKIRAGAWAVGVFAVVAVGALTGALIKTDQQKEEAIKQFRETTPEEQIAALEAHKESLLKQRSHIQFKLDRFNARVEERKKELEAKKESEK
ncbi:hypothetical protein B0I35DRAFT_441396 [Stachybotrys elegans]|uniref:Uncharacterized protein n=1 Tax=Stachybotrys elegans TaxID=80388 RepID=A0A8K0SMV4_9HYPO|nr:hypothetical protein B0I35DRAFT_441396 [Stachybotrys elegans]